LQKYHGSGKNKVIVFVLYKKEATRVEDMLRQRGFNVQGIHADKTQKDRTLALDSFKSGKCPLLVATDVAARGLDVPDVEYVINYAFPLTIEDYVHRIGRTGRAGKTGVAHTFFTTFDKAHSGELVQILKEAKQEVPADLMKFGTAIKVKEQKQTGSIDINKVAGLSFDSDSD
jgi:ATP-dependent RNA helicase DBP3